MALAPLLYNITFDSQTRTLYFWDKAGHEIYHCEIPSPAPALPTVSMSGDFNDQNNKFSFANSHVDTTVYPNVTCIMYEWVTQQYKEYDTTKSYAVWSYSLLNGSLVGRTGFSVEPLTSGGKTIIQCLNSTSENITASYCFIAVCSSSDAAVITVYDSSNNPYNAFKYTSDGTDYYYVLDGTQTDWTDDLSAIGYKLPTIGYVSSLKTEISMNAGDLQTLYGENGTKMTVSTYGISYPAIRVYSSSSDTTGTAVVNKNWTVHGPQFSSGDLSVSNLTGSTQTIQRIAFIK